MSYNEPRKLDKKLSGFIYVKTSHITKKRETGRGTSFPPPFNSMSMSVQSPGRYDNRQSKVPAAPSPTPEPETFLALEE